jgi:inner membrane protein
VVLGISDVRAIQAQVSMTWNGQAVAFLPGTSGVPEIAAGIHAPVPIDPKAGSTSFRFPLTVNGSTSVFFTPTARETEVEIDSNAANPGFAGNWLPVERSVSASGFQARWAVPFLGRNYPQAWTSTPAMTDAIGVSRFGVELNHPIDQYRMTDRSVKYATLFVLLTFATVWLIEILTNVRVHPIQYLLFGASLALFYLLELSLSEHLPFVLAYAIASLAVVGMVTGYAIVMVKRLKRALIIGAWVTTLWGYLYVLLTNEDYALLIGSIGLFMILGGIMILTRRVDWSSATDLAAGSAG